MSDGEEDDHSPVTFRRTPRVAVGQTQRRHKRKHHRRSATLSPTSRQHHDDEEEHFVQNRGSSRRLAPPAHKSFRDHSDPFPANAPDARQLMQLMSAVQNSQSAGNNVQQCRGQMFGYEHEKDEEHDRHLAALLGSNVVHRTSSSSGSNSKSRNALRKTTSVPTDISIEEEQQRQKYHAFVDDSTNYHLPVSPHHLLRTNAPPAKSVSPKFRHKRPQPLTVRHMDYHESPSDSDILDDSTVNTTDIEELKVAQETIEALTRRLPTSPQQIPNSLHPKTANSTINRYNTRVNSNNTVNHSNPNSSLNVSDSSPESSQIASAAPSRRTSGITTRQGSYPRGVMQFLPSVRNSNTFLSRTPVATDTYSANKQRRAHSESHGDEESEELSPDSHQLRHNQSLILADHHSPLTSPIRRKVSLPGDFYNYEQSHLVEHNDLYAAPSPISNPADMEGEAYGRGEKRRLSRYQSMGPDDLAVQTRRRNKGVQRQLSQHEKQLSDVDMAAAAYHHDIKGVENLAGFKRFGSLLRSFAQNSQQQQQQQTLDVSSEEALHLARVAQQTPWRTTTVGGGGPQRQRIDINNLHSADEYLWRRRSKGSLKKHEDTRTHVVKELFDIEEGYVKNLQLMVQKYMRPLKSPQLYQLIEPALVDKIFFQIPEILQHHEQFYAKLKSRLDNWDSQQKIGDIVLQNFSKQGVIDTYTAFINNWKDAKLAIRTACQTKKELSKYLERCSREHDNKLTLDALLIMPVQRIPRYELLIKELLKHTPVEHADHNLLLRAQNEIHELAIKINYVEQESGLGEQMQQRLREIEALVDGLDDLVKDDRVFHRYDLISISTSKGSKERCMFLLSDLLLLTSVKRKSNTLKKSAASSSVGSTTGTASGGGDDFLQNHKFKLLMKISLEDLVIAKNTLPALNKVIEEVAAMEEDSRVLGEVSKMVDLIKTSHTDLERTLDDFRLNLRKKLKEKNDDLHFNTLLIAVELLVTTADGLETMMNVQFPNANHRGDWEKCFRDVKETLEQCQSKRPPPTFLKSLTVPKSRSGLYFTCASSTSNKSEASSSTSIPPTVWICSSDGYVGQMCLLNMDPEPDVQCCNGVTSSRILCIAAVPAPKGQQKRKKRLSAIPAARDSLTDSLTTSQSATINLQLDSESSDNEESDVNVSGTDSLRRARSAGVTSLVGGRDEESSSLRSEPSVTGATNSPLRQTQDELDEHVPTMWLGTEDGTVIVYNYNDNLRTRRSKLRAQHDSAVTSIVYVEDKVFVGLAKGELICYERRQDDNWTWDLSSSRQVRFTTELLSSISAMTNVPNRVWCSARNQMHVVNYHSLAHEDTFHVNSDSDTSIECMSSSGLGVWLAVSGSPVLKLHHVLTFECLLEVNVCPVVTKTLAGCDDIIRQHKLACLRVTSLMCCKDLLWAGTSAGVIVNLQLPHLSHNTSRMSSAQPVSVSPIGHCGQCRFLVCVDPQTPSSRSDSFSVTGITDQARRRMSLNVAALHQGKMYVIAGGEGFEDFEEMRTEETDDSLGQNDSTNHILVWEV